MSYSEIKRSSLVYRNRAIKKDIPVWFLSLADSYFNKAVYVKEICSKDKKMPYKYYYDRGIRELLKALAIYKCHYANSQDQHHTNILEKNHG